MSAAAAACPLCEQPGGVPVWHGERLRVVRVDDTPDHPAFYRVIWNAHVAELSELGAGDLQHCMGTVVTVERVMREQLRPTKVNLATLGNMVPHLHWHVIARFDWDTHFPSPVWAPSVRAPEPARLLALKARLPALDAAVQRALA